MFQIKPISAGGIAGALQKAERYRLLNEPTAAESICLDILDLEPENQQALIMLLLARTDQFGRAMGSSVTQAREVLPRLASPYSRAYYAGVISERNARAILHAGRPGSAPMAYDAFRAAMDAYEEAERLAAEGNDDARLRWNTCARILNASPGLAPRSGEPHAPIQGD